MLLLPECVCHAAEGARRVGGGSAFVSALPKEACGWLMVIDLACIVGIVRTPHPHPQLRAHACSATATPQCVSTERHKTQADTA